MSLLSTWILPVWNAPLVQEIRRDLLAGTFHDYCLDSPDCPIVKKAVQARALSPREERQRRLRVAWQHAKRSLGGRPRSLYRRARAAWM